MGNEPDISIVIRLRDLRKQHKLSQEELAEALGVSRQSVIALEQGKSLPSIPLVVSMCRFFRSSFEDIFDLPLLVEEVDPVNNSIKIIPQPEDRKETIMQSELGPWRPFRESVSLRDAMDRLFEDSFITPKGGTLAIPKIDIMDKKGAIVVKAELPGMKEEDVEIEIADGVMTVSGEKVEEKEEQEEGYYHKESHSGSFSRSFALPSEVVAEKAVAEMKDGVLSVTIPKIEPKKATKIKIAKK